MTAYLGWQLWVGPAYLPRTNLAQYDWTGLAAGVASDFSPSTTNTVSMVSGSLSCTVASASSFAAKGGFWIGPNGAGQAWEYCGYTGIAANTLNGLVREAALEHNGSHTAGAVVRQWWPLTQNDGKLHLVEELDDTLTAITWTAELSGIRAPQVVFRQNHIAVIQTRASVGVSFTNFLLGFLESSSIQDDRSRVRGWSARFICLASLLAKVEVQGVKIGKFNIGLHANAQASDVLGAAYKERQSGDYSAADPDFGAQSVLDGELSTLWISDRTCGTHNAPAGGGRISQIYMNPPPSINQGHKWVQIDEYNLSGGKHLVIWDPLMSGGAGGKVSMDVTSEDWSTTPDLDAYVVVCESETVYTRENPAQKASLILDEVTGDAAGFFSHLRASGGCIAIEDAFGFSSKIRWGTEIATVPPDGTDSWGSSGWQTITSAIGVNQTLRYNYNTSAFEVGYGQSTAHTIRGTVPGDTTSLEGGDRVWLFVDLPGMGLMLRDDCTATNPAVGEKLYIVDSNRASTNGLPASGTIQIAEERINYSAKDKESVTVSGRAVESTTAVAHAKGDLVQLVFTQNGVRAATDAQAIRTTTLKRQGTVLPVELILRWSMLQARTPADSGHVADYEVGAQIDGNTLSTLIVTHAPTVRARSFVAAFYRMSVSPARARLNELEFQVDESTYDADNWLSSGQTVELVIERILENSGAPLAAILTTTGGIVPDGFTTDDDYAWRVVVDLAEFAGSFVSCGRMSKITASPDTFWITALGSYTPVSTWDRNTAVSVEKVNRASGGASQIKLNWQTPDNVTKGIELYPAAPHWQGKVVELDPLIYASSGAAQLGARKRYYLARYPYQLLIAAAEADLSVRPRQIQRVIWQLDDEMQAIDRMMIVTSVDTLIENQSLSMVVSGLQIDREVEG